MENRFQPRLIEPRFTNLINEQNLDLWKKVSHCFKIKLEESPESGYLTYFDVNSVIIEIDMRDRTPASFTHELLHLYMKIEGVHVAWELKKKITADMALTEIFSTSLRVHIGNCLEHVKMLPLFLSLGFRNEDFISDYHQKIIDDGKMQDLESEYYKNGSPVLAKVDTYIDLFFTMKASNNPEFDYSSYFKRMEKLDELLFKIHFEFWEVWKNFKIGQAKRAYFPSLNSYLERLKIWKNLSRPE